MKRIIALFLVLSFCISFVSCSSSNQSDESAVSSTLSSENLSAENDSSLNDSKDASADETTSSEEQSADTSADISDDQSEDTSDDTSKDDFNLTPALFKAQDDNGNVVWLFGSIHVGDDRFYPLPEYVTNAFDSADALAVEFDLVAFQKDYSAMTSALSLMVYRDGTTIKDHISAETYEAAKKIFTENNSYNVMFDYYMPILWQNTINSFYYEKLGLDTTNGIDAALINKAYDAKKQVISIESAEFQYGMMAGFSDDLQVMLLEQTIEAYDQVAMGKLSIEMLKTVWAGGDEKTLEQALLSSDAKTDEEKALYSEYTKATITDRNIGMADFAEEALKSGREVFVCVGAAHIVGDGGIVDLLENRGYTVEKVKG